MQSFLIKYFDILFIKGIAEKRSSKLVRTKFNVQFKNQFN